MGNNQLTSIPFIEGDAFVEAISRLVERTQGVVSDRKKSLVERHNAFTIYTIIQLLFATGHRPVIDAFALLHHISLEHGLCLIADKVADESRAFRLVGLPETSRLQIREYIRYLDVISKTAPVSKDDEELRAAIAQFLSSPEAKTLPLFFLLPTQILPVAALSPSVIEAYLREYIDLPANFGRHWLATELGWAGADAQEIQRLLGHVESLDHPYGRYSFLAPKSSALQTAGRIDELLKRSGFKLIKFPVRARNIVFSAGVDPKTKVFENGEIAYYSRKRRREERESLVKDHVSKVRAYLKPSLTRRHVTEEDVEDAIRMLEGLCNEFGGSLKWCQRLFYRRLDADRRRGVRVDSRRLFALESEPSPFFENALGDYETAFNARSEFGRELARGAYRCNNVPQVAALATVSLALNGLIATKTVLEGLFKPLSEWVVDRGELILSVGSALSDEVVEGPAVARIWDPDKISASILLHLPKSLKLVGTERDAYISSLKSIVSSLAGDARAPYTWLAKRARNLALIEQPGIVRSISEDRIIQRGLSAGMRERLATGQRASVGDGEEYLNIDRIDFITEVCQKKTSLDPKVGIDDYKTWLNKQLRCIQSGIATDQDRQTNRSKEKYSKKLVTFKRRLVEVLLWFERESTSGDVPGLPELTRDVLSLNRYIIKLAREGTQFKAALSWRYLRTLIRIGTINLVRHSSQKAFSTLDESEYEELYFSVLDDCVPSVRVVCFVALREFHNVLMDTFNHDNVDWAYVLGLGDWNGIDALASVDANVVTYADYRRVLGLISDSKALSPSMRLQLASLVFLGYRFGLRWSEALYLERKDIKFDITSKSLEVRVRPNIHRPLKTRSSRRTLPLVGSLSDEEAELLEHLLEISYSIAPSCATALLFNDGLDPEASIDRSFAGFIVNRALKLASGDPSLRYHHLRHTHANVLFYMATCSLGIHKGIYAALGESICEGREIGDADYKKLWRRSSISSARLQLVADFMGHGSLGSMSSYIRLYPELHGACVAESCKLPKAKMLSCYFDVSEDATWKRLQRLENINSTDVTDIDIAGVNNVDVEFVCNSEAEPQDDVLPPLIEEAATSKMSLLDIDHVSRKLFFDANEEKVERYAYLLDLDLCAFKESSNKAAQLLSYYRFEGENTMGGDRAPAMGYYVEKSQETIDVRCVLNVIQKKIDRDEMPDSELVYSFLHIAGVSYRSGHRRLRFLSYRDAELYWRTLEEIGISGVNLKPDHQKSERPVNSSMTDALSILQDVDFQTHLPWHDAPLKRRKRWLTETRVLDFGGAMIASASALYRVMYILAIYYYYSHRVARHVSQ